ncbi:MAG: hypothetical protein ACE5GE_13595, partial [Phycisphaerae bacterium]
MDIHTIYCLTMLACNFLAPPAQSGKPDVAPAVSAPSSPTVILRAVPADAWIVLAYTPTDKRDSTESTTRTGSTFSTASAVLALARQMGLLNAADPSMACWIDAVTTLPLVTRYPFALCLLDGQARPLESGGYRLDGLSAALILRTGGNDGPVQARIQHLLNTYVNNQVARIEPFRLGRYRGYRLIDRRLPDWCMLQWGAMGKNYVVTLGRGAFERLAQIRKHDAPSLTDDAWFRKARGRCLGDRTDVFLSMRFKDIREHLEPVMAGKPDAVLEALGLANVDRGLWTFGKTGRAVQALALWTSGPTDEGVTICQDAEDDARAQKVIPAQATQYAVLEESPAQVVRLVRDAYLAARSPSSRQRLETMWARVETETGIDVERDLLQQLGPRLVIHDFPKHPLGIPIARTIVAEVTGS